MRTISRYLLPEWLLADITNKDIPHFLSTVFSLVELVGLFQNPEWKSNTSNILRRAKSVVCRNSARWKFEPKFSRWMCSKAGKSAVARANLQHGVVSVTPKPQKWATQQQCFLTHFQLLNLGLRKANNYPARSVRSRVYPPESQVVLSQLPNPHIEK